MKYRYLLKCLVIMLSAWQVGNVSAGTYSSTATDQPSVVMDLAFARMDKTEILDANVDGNEINTGLGRRSGESNFALGVRVWLPMLYWWDMHINGVAMVDHIPSRNTTASSVFVIEGDDEQQQVEIASDVQLKSHQTNFAIGVNAVRFIDEEWFVEAMLAGGVTRYSVRGEMFGLDASFNQGSDHPSVTSTYPFISGELALGKRLSLLTKAFGFIQFAVARRDKPFRLVANSESDYHINIGTPHRWFKIGVSLTRTLNI